MKTFYCIEGDTGAAKRYSLEDVTKIAQRQAASRPDRDVIILKSYATAEIPITNVNLTLTED